MIKGLLLADLHIGACDPQVQFQEVKDLVFSTIKKEKPDYIIFLGDFFDHKASLNDKISYYSFLLVTQLIDLIHSMKKKIKVRFIYGTESHEWNQYQIIESIDTDVDMKVVHTVSDEELFEDLNVLYLPEEQIYDKEEYYGAYLHRAKEYDYIFGHGVIREVMKEAALASDNQSKNRAKPAVFSTGELLYACKGQVYFGHYHINSNINDQVFYVGSFDRWQFGEEEDKGFYLVNKKGDTYTNKFIVNSATPVYKTIHFGFDNQIFKDQEVFVNKLDQMDKLMNDGVLDYVRYDFNVPTNVENPEFIINHIKERYKFNDNVKTQIVHGYMEEKKQREKEEVDKWNQENAPLFDPSLPIDEKVAYFIRMEFKKDIPVSTIQVYLYKDLDDILQEQEGDANESDGRE